MVQIDLGIRRGEPIEFPTLIAHLLGVLYAFRGNRTLGRDVDNIESCRIEIRVTAVVKLRRGERYLKRRQPVLVLALSGTDRMMQQHQLPAAVDVIEKG